MMVKRIGRGKGENPKKLLIGETAKTVPIPKIPKVAITTGALGLDCMKGILRVRMT